MDLLEEISLGSVGDIKDWSPCIPEKFIEENAIGLTRLPERYVPEYLYFSFIHTPTLKKNFKSMDKYRKTAQNYQVRYGKEPASGGKGNWENLEQLRAIDEFICSNYPNQFAVLNQHPPRLDAPQQMFLTSGTYRGDPSVASSRFVPRGPNMLEQGIQISPCYRPYVSTTSQPEFAISLKVKNGGLRIKMAEQQFERNYMENLIQTLSLRRIEVDNRDMILEIQSEDLIRKLLPFGISKAYIVVSKFSEEFYNVFNLISKVGLNDEGWINVRNLWIQSDRGNFKAEMHSFGYFGSYLFVPEIVARLDSYNFMKDYKSK